MTVAELIEALQEMPEGAEVRFASQPTYPLEHSVGVPVLVDLDADPDDDDRRITDDMSDPVVYLPETWQGGYLPGIVRDALGW